MSDMYVCIYKQANKHARLGLGPFLDKNSSSSYFSVLHAFAKPADFKFTPEKVVRLTE